MKTCFETLRAYIAAHPPSYGDSDACSILEMLYSHYNELNGMDSEEIKRGFESLYQRMNGMPIREMDKIIDPVCCLCQEHEKNGFIEGVKVGIRFAAETS